MTALTAHMAHEGVLHGVRSAFLSDALDRRDVAARGIEGEQHARINGESVHQHRTGATLAEIAGFLRAGQPEVFTYGQEKCAVMRNAERTSLAVDAELDVRIGRLAAFCRSGDGLMRLLLEHAQLATRANERCRTDHNSCARLDERASGWIAGIRRSLFFFHLCSSLGCQRAAS